MEDAMIRELREQIAALTERLEKLEGSYVGQAVPPARREEAAPRPGQAEASAPPNPLITQEELLSISAAVAAYLGVRAHIRQIRLISSPAWAQEGRASIQASHRLHS